MITADLVAADVVDIRDRRAPLPKRVVMDANVLYFIHYPNFADLQAAGGRGPQHYQQSEYPRWFKAVASRGTEFFTSVSTLGELVRLIEYAELETLWLTSPERDEDAEFSPKQCKAVRYEYADRLVTLRDNSRVYLNVARKYFDLLPMRSEDEDTNAAIQEWCSSAGDFTDSVMVTHARYAGINHIVTDDIDLLTFDGITAYTANRSAVEAAEGAGKLRNPRK